MRGLKPKHDGEAAKDSVASFTDAWIETCRDTKSCTCQRVASFTDAWIETTLYKKKSISKVVASFTDAWIETSNHLPGWYC